MSDNNHPSYRAGYEGKVGGTTRIDAASRRAHDQGQADRRLHDFQRQQAEKLYAPRSSSSPTTAYTPSPPIAPKIFTGILWPVGQILKLGFLALISTPVATVYESFVDVVLLLLPEEQTLLAYSMDLAESYGQSPLLGFFALQAIFLIPAILLIRLARQRFFLTAAITYGPILVMSGFVYLTAGTQILGEAGVTDVAEVKRFALLFPLFGLPYLLRLAWARWRKR